MALVRSGASQSLLDLDGVLRVMKETGTAMDKRYRETALGGLAADYERSLQNTPELLLGSGFNSLACLN